MNNLLESKKVRMMLITLASLITLLVVFGFGITVGYDRASFSSHFEENYYRNFNGGTTGGMMGYSMGPMPMSEHGIVGTVLDVIGSMISVQDSVNNEHSVTISSGTVIREGDENIFISNIKSGDHIIVIGEPNPQGQIRARFIRIFNASSTILPIP